MTKEQLQTQGAVWLIDKPYGWTSFDAVAKIRSALKHALKGKNKVGHAGTLDPLASGLLIICGGKATKSIQGIQDAEKEYTGTITLGSTTPSYDLETEVDAEFDISHVTNALVLETAATFIGEQEQTAPAFSAKKIDGKRAYELARKGKDPGIKPHVVTIREFEITRFEGKEVDFRISCSKGTYIRSIAHDFGKRLNAGAHLSKLVRTRIGKYDLKDAVSPQDLVAVIREWHN